MNPFRQRAGAPRLLRFLALNASAGAGLGLLFAALLLLSDVAGLGMLFASPSTPLVAWLLYFSTFALTFASLMMGTAIMLLPYRPEPSRRLRR